MDDFKQRVKRKNFASEMKKVRRVAVHFQVALFKLQGNGDAVVLIFYFDPLAS